MKQSFGLARMLRSGLRHRPARALAALIALTVSAAVATALLTLYADLASKLHREFRSFGANIVVTNLPSDPSALARATVAAGPDARLARFAYAVAGTDRNTPIVVAGVDFNAIRQLDSWWQVERWPSAPGEALLGTRAADFIADERHPTLTYAGHPHTFTGAGRLHTGSDEDSRIYIDLATFTAWTQVQPGVLEIQVPGGAARVDAAIARLRTALPSATVQPVRQLVAGESGIVERTRALMLGAMLLIALTVAISVLATLSAGMLERRRDFALMKALGSSHIRMVQLFALETLLLAAGGILAGYLLGSALAWLISEINFHTAALPRLTVLPVVLLLNLAIATLAALLPLQTLRRLEPATLLKGE